MDVILSEHAHTRLRQRYPQFRALIRSDLEEKIRAGVSRSYVTLTSTPGNRRLVSFLTGAHTVYASVWFGMTIDERQVMTIITILTQEMAQQTIQRASESRNEIHYHSERVKHAKSRRYRRKRRGWETEE